MDRFPHQIIILKPTNNRNNPYDAENVVYDQIYTGRCRCFLNKQAALRTAKTVDCDYQVVIPDRSMIDVGENFKVAVKMQNTKNGKVWDLVGYVKDFARYDRVCNVYFQMVKQEMVRADIPSGPNENSEKVLWGLDMSGVSFNCKDVDRTSVDMFHVDELPLWATFGDWSKKRDWENAFKGSAFTKLCFIDMTECITLKNAFSNMSGLKEITLPAVLPNCQTVEYAFLFGTTANSVDLTVPYMPMCSNYKDAFHGHYKTLTFIGDVSASEPDKIGVYHILDLTGAFKNASIEHLEFRGKLGASMVYDESGAYKSGTGYNYLYDNGLDAVDLDHDSIMSIIQALVSDMYSDPNHPEYTKFMLGANNLAKLSNAEKAIASDKGWTLI